MKTWRLALVSLAVLAGVFVLRPRAADPGEKNVEKRVFELRTYFAADGKMDALHARFKNHTIKLLEKHGMQLIGFWTDSKEPNRKLIYLVAHKSKDAADASWKAFRVDPDWVAVKKKSEEGGSLTEKIDIVWLNPTEYSAMR
jgi:NIPSNAP